MKLAFCAACGSTNGLHHHPLVTHAQGGGDDERDLITLCFPCHAKLRPRRLNGVANISRQGAPTGSRRSGFSFPAKLTRRNPRPPALGQGPPGVPSPKVPPSRRDPADGVRRSCARPGRETLSREGAREVNSAKSPAWLVMATVCGCGKVACGDPADVVRSTDMGGWLGRRGSSERGRAGRRRLAAAGA